MFITKKYLSRRAILKGAGASVALPFLSAMVPAATALAQTAAAGNKRVGFFYIPHGAVMHNTAYGAEMDHWHPAGNFGDELKLNKIMAPLEAYKPYLNTFSNLLNEASKGSVHTLNPATWLSGIRPDNNAAGASMAQTLDQVIVDHIGQETALPSLQVASETTIQGAACGNSGCYYSSTLSFASETAPLPMEYNPRKLFIQMFGEGDTNEERGNILSQQASLLDMVAESTRSLQRELGADDKQILEGYLDTVREIERRVEKATQQDLSTVDVPNAPIGELDNFAEQVSLMFDLLAIAYQADLTRVISYMMVSEGTNRTYNHIGVPDAFHPVSHHADDRERLYKLVRIQTWHMERFRDFLDKMAATPDGEGSILDNSIFMYGSNMSNSDRHDNYPVPNLLVGGGQGTLKLGGQHIELPERTPLANLHLTLLHKLGIEAESFADSTGIISEV
ncbi:DUF1552 domain-containing protein [Gammaproteobacteria bacterium]|nr:DUF1552 domain-containing protein [Gammaproteobacteria bacterium]